MTQRVTITEKLRRLGWPDRARLDENMHEALDTLESVRTAASAAMQHIRCSARCLTAGGHSAEDCNCGARGAWLDVYAATKPRDRA